VELHDTRVVLISGWIIWRVEDVVSDLMKLEQPEIVQQRSRNTPDTPEGR